MLYLSNFLKRVANRLGIAWHILPLGVGVFLRRENPVFAFRDRHFVYVEHAPQKSKMAPDWRTERVFRDETPSNRLQAG